MLVATIIHVNDKTKTLCSNDISIYVHRITSAHFEEKNGRKVMLVIFNINHTVADGFNASRFFDDLQRAITSFKLFFLQIRI